MKCLSNDSYVQKYESKVDISGLKISIQVLQ